MELTSNYGEQKLKVPIEEGYIPTPQFTSSHYEASIKGTAHIIDAKGFTQVTDNDQQ